MTRNETATAGPVGSGDGGERTYQYREIGEGEGWRDCTKATYDSFQSDPHIDTRENPRASPVGYEALREALAVIEYAQTIDDHYDRLEFLGNWSEGDVSEWPDFSAFLAEKSHPTTGQETVATPRDGGVREALTVLDRLDDEAIAGGGRHRVSVPLLSWSEVDDLRAALSAPGSAGPGEPTDALVDRFSDALKAKLRASEQKYGWRNGWLKTDWQADCQSDLARHVAKGDPLDVAAYAAFCWHHGWTTATPSPAQEPGTGDTGDGWRTKAADEVEGIASLWSGDGRAYAMTVAAILRAEEPTELPAADEETKRAVARAWARFQRGVTTPATTAETRGPAEGAR